MNQQDPFQLCKNLLQEINQETSSEAEILRIKYLGKNGSFKKLSSLIKEVPIDQKKLFGQELNQLKQKIEKKIAELENHQETRSEEHTSELQSH